MTREKYLEAIKQKDKFVILTDTSEVNKVFDTEKEASEYCSARMPHTKNNKITMYITTGIENTMINGILVRNDIKPYMDLHIGLNW